MNVFLDLVFFSLLVLFCYFLMSGAIPSGIQKVAVMNNIADIIENIQIGLGVAIFLLNTGRGLPATELCNECLILLNNIPLGIEDQFNKSFYSDIYDLIFNTYYVIYGYPNAAIYARNLIDMFHDAGILITLLGLKYQRQSRYVEAKELYESAVNIIKTLSHKNEEAVLNGMLGAVFRSLGEYQKAKEYHEKALAISVEIGDKEGKGRSYESLGNVFHSLGEYQKAQEYYEKALAISIETGDKEGEGASYGNLGNVFRSLGIYRKAHEYHEKALAISIEIGDKKREGGCYGNLGLVFYSLGEYQKAKEYHEQALAISIEIGDKEGEGSSYGNLGLVFHSLGEYQKAKEYHEKALAINIEIGDKKGEGISYGNLGAVFYSLGIYRKAQEYHEKALAISIEIGDKKGKGTSYGNLGLAFYSLGEYQKAKEYHEKALAINIEIGDKKVEGISYRNLGAVFYSLGIYRKAQEYHEKALAISIEIGDKEGEGASYGNLGLAFYSLGEYQKAKEYHEKALAIKIEIGDKDGEGTSYGNLGLVFHSLGEYQKAKEYLEKALAITIEIGDKKGEGASYGNLGLVFRSLGIYRMAHEYYEKALAIAIEIGDKKREGRSYGNLAAVFHSLGDYEKAKNYFKKALVISKEIGDRCAEEAANRGLGDVFRSLSEYYAAEEYLEKARLLSSDTGDNMAAFQVLVSFTILKLSQSKLQEAISCLVKCLEKYEQLRNFLKGNDEFQISLLEEHGTFPYKLFSKLVCDTANPSRDALYVEELGRARNLAEFMADKFSVENHISANRESWFGIENILSRESNCACLYISYYERDFLLWVLKTNGDIYLRTSNVNEDTLRAESVVDVEGILNKSFKSFGILPKSKCEDRSLDDNVPISLPDESRAPLRGNENSDIESSLHLCCKMIIAPVADLLTEPEIIIVPDRCSYRVPFAALRDRPAGKYLSETYKIRIVPSLTTLRLIQDCPEDYHSHTGALVVGDPKVGEVLYQGRPTNITPLPCARKEAEMVGRLLGVQPLLGECATKQAVLQAIHSVSLMHFAAHGNAERGEIALSPIRTSNSIPQEKDYLLMMSDISQIQLRAELVVLSCCHSGRGMIRKEGIIGIARAFLGSGARSVLVASWAIEDTATEQLMSRFYELLADGESASESLHQAMKWMRSNDFAKPSQWAPFMLVGDNVTFDFKMLSKSLTSDK